MNIEVNLIRNTFSELNLVILTENAVALSVWYFTYLTFSLVCKENANMITELLALS